MLVDGRRLRAILLALVCVTGLGMSRRPVTMPRAMVVGTINDGEQAGVGGVEVRIRGTSFSTLTDSAGRFTLEGVPEGRQIIVVSRAGSPPIYVPELYISAEQILSVTISTSRYEGPPWPLGTFISPWMLIVDGVILLDPPKSEVVPALPAVSAVGIVKVEIIAGARAAALYGQRAANGVVIIETRHQLPPPARS